MKKPAIVKSGLVVLDGQEVNVEPHVQGIASSADDITLFGRKWKENVSDRVLERPKLTRTTDGASTVEIPLDDQDGDLRTAGILQEPHDIELDGLWFTYVKLSLAEDETLTVTYEDREVNRLRQLLGPRKAFRDRVTRAEFIRAGVRRLKPAIPFFSPELHVVQPIGDATAARTNDATKGLTRGHGFSRNANVTVKHAKADQQQITVIERALDTASSLKASRQAMIATVMCMTQENSCRTGGDGPFQQNPSWPGDPNDVANATRNFLVRAPTYPGGLLKYLRTNSHSALGPAIQTIQKSAFPGAYAQWESEATHTVDLYLGGTTAGAAAAAEPSAETGKKYSFEVKPKEDEWDAGDRLAQEVGWHRYVSNGIYYYLSETDTLTSMPRMTIAKDEPGIETIAWDCDQGKPADQVTVTAYAKDWAAPPGTVGVLEGQGPANGEYFVNQIEALLRTRNSLCTITLKRPTNPLPEPAAAAATGETKGRSPSRGTNMPAAVSKSYARAQQLAAWHVRYVYGGGHGGFSSHPDSLDCSAAVSDALHAGGFLSTVLTSVPLEHWGEAGAGEWITVYANVNHAWMEFKVNGQWKPWGTSVGDGGGLGFHPTPSAAYKAGFTKRHPRGY